MCALVLLSLCFCHLLLVVLLHLLFLPLQLFLLLSLSFSKISCAGVWAGGQAGGPGPMQGCWEQPLSASPLNKGYWCSELLWQQTKKGHCVTPMTNAKTKQTRNIKRQEKTTPFGVNLTRSQVLYRADQERYNTLSKKEGWSHLIQHTSLQTLAMQTTCTSSQVSKMHVSHCGVSSGVCRLSRCALWHLFDTTLVLHMPSSS